MNVIGTENIFKIAQKKNIKVVFASSSSVYGENKKVPFETTDNVDHPISLYAATKKSNELMAHTYGHLYGFKTTGLRFFTVYGPWGRPDMAYYLFAKEISNDKPIKVFNNGEMERDFTYIDDIVDGIYKLKSSYYGYKYDQSFSVTDNSLKGGLAPDLILAVDKKEYVAGETVSVFGKIENIFYYDSVSLKIETPDVSKINCFAQHSCGLGSEKKIRVSEGTEGATFYMNYKIPSGDSSVGKYNVIADTHFGEIKKSFFVLSESDVVGQISPPSSEIIPKTSKIIEKFNRIADTEIPIILSEKSSEDSILVPRVIQGSLFTSARGEESDVNLRITTTAGQCIIGQGSDCLVSESTRKPGAIYSIVSIDDVNYKIRYSGDDVRLEKFSILPENSNSKIDIDDWNVEIIKDEQPTRFYYKVSYVALE